MLIILEGVDGTGKSTLARQLADVLTHSGLVTSTHRGPPTSHPLNEYLTPLLNYRPGTGHHWILDRWHVGERVYPALRGRSTQLDDVMWWYVNQHVRRLGGVVVHCRRSPGGLEKTYRERGESELLAEVEAAEKLYAEALHTVCAAQLPYSCDLPGSVGVEQITHTARVCEEKYTTPLARYVTYVGPPRPRYLLLGEVRHRLDRVGQLARRTDWRPAFVPYGGTSGHWLLESVLADPKLAGGVGLANAADVDNVRALWRDLDEPRTVTLGRNAHRATARHPEVKHGQVPHPQYMRRFFNSHRVEYREVIERALTTGEDLSEWRPENTWYDQRVRSESESERKQLAWQ